jgi:hypothetical protein
LKTELKLLSGAVVAAGAVGISGADGATGIKP